MGKLGKTTEQIIEEFINKRGAIYDYSKVIYIGTQKKVCIICKEHGEFWQTPNNHLNGQGCPTCKANLNAVRCTLSQSDVIQKCVNVHGNIFDYSKFKYVSMKTKSIVVCKQHGDFLVTPDNHISKGSGCPQCVGRGKSTDDIIQEFVTIYGDEYDYSKYTFVKSSTKGCIICREHGEFWQSPSEHKIHGCPKCVGKNKTTSDVIKDFIKIHGDRYSYTKVNYINSRTKVSITCPIHGDFLQTPNNHLNGQGCPVCCNSIGENVITQLFKQHNIPYQPQKTFDDCRNPITGRLLRYDFFTSNVLIEYDGIQHSEPIDRFGGCSEFEKRKQLDDIKTKYADDNGYTLIRISHNSKNDIESILQTALNF